MRREVATRLPTSTLRRPRAVAWPIPRSLDPEQGLLIAAKGRSVGVEQDAERVISEIFSERSIFNVPLSCYRKRSLTGPAGNLGPGLDKPHTRRGRSRELRLGSPRRACMYVCVARQRTSRQSCPGWQRFFLAVNRRWFCRENLAKVLRQRQQWPRGLVTLVCAPHPMRALFYLFGPGVPGFGDINHKNATGRDKRSRHSTQKRPTPNTGSHSSTSSCLGGRAPSPVFNTHKPSLSSFRRHNQKTACNSTPISTPSMTSVLIPNAPLMAQSLGGAFVLDMAIQLIGWAGAATLQTEKFYDLFGSLAFASTAVTTFISSPQQPRQQLITAMVCTWTFRLGAFLVRRVFRDGSDSRFDDVKKQPGMFAVYWFMQGLWVFVTALPCFLINGLSSQSSLNAGDWVCFALYAIGIVTETTADLQKQIFKSDPANKGKFIDVGLWSLSRHPNYFGEILVWLGVCGVGLSANAGPGVSIASLCSPLFVTFLLTKVSGVPILEKSADERWGSEQKYVEYKKNTPCLVPKLPGLGRKEV